MSNILLYRGDNTRIEKNSKFTEEIYNDISKYDFVKVEMSNRDSLEVAVNKIKKADCIFLFANGDENEINHRMTGDGTYTRLIDTEDTDLFTGKKIIAFSCHTLVGLGPKCIEKGTLSYAGFLNEIDREIGSENEEIISEYYSKIFHEVIEVSIKRRLKFKSFEHLMRFTLNKYELELITGENNNITSIFGGIYNTINVTINSFKAIGDIELSIS